MFHPIRHAKSLVRYVLVWFVLSLGVAIASPIVHPQDLQLVCTGSGAMKMVVLTEDGSDEESSLGMACPLCAIAAAITPQFPEQNFDLLLPLSYAVQAIPAAIIAQRTQSPLSARGPPNIF